MYKEQNVDVTAQDNQQLRQLQCTKQNSEQKNNEITLHIRLSLKKQYSSQRNACADLAHPL